MEQNNPQRLAAMQGDPNYSQALGVIIPKTTSNNSILRCLTFPFDVEANLSLSDIKSRLSLKVEQYLQKEKLSMEERINSFVKQQNYDYNCLCSLANTNQKDMIDLVNLIQSRRNSNQLAEKKGSGNEIHSSLEKRMFVTIN